MRRLLAWLVVATFTWIHTESIRAQSDFIRGDVDGNLVVDNQDVNLLQQHIFIGTPIQCRDAADVDDGGTVTVVDLNRLSSYVNTGSPVPPSPFPNCGQDPTPDALTCVTGCPTSSGCDTLCQMYPSFMPSGDTAINGGHYTFCDFVLGPNMDLTVHGACTLDVAGSLSMAATSSIQAFCTPLVINHLDDTGGVEIYGEITDTCASANDSGGTLILRSRSSIILGSDGGPDASITAADIFIGDPEYAPRPQVDSVSVVLTGESLMTNLPPVAAIRGTYLGSATIEIEIIQLSLVSLPLQATIYYGNGDSAVNPPLTHQYTFPQAGTYRVNYLLRDSQGNAVQPSLVVKVPSGEVLQAHVSPFQTSALTGTVGAPITFEGQAPGDCDQAEWDFDGAIVPLSSAVHTYQTAGMQTAIFDVTANEEVWDFPAYAYVTETSSKRPLPDPPAPIAPFPCDAPPLLTTAAAPDTHSTTCAPCALCDVPLGSLGFPPGSTLLVMGDVTIKSTRVGGWLVTGYADATIIIRPGFFMSGAAGGAGGMGASGGSGGGFAQVTLAGEIIECGGFYEVGSGGNGGVDAAGGCPADSKGGRGGNAGAVVYAAPLGSMSWCGDITLVGGNGGDGGASGAFAAPAPGACMNGCRATAKAGNGGQGGGGLMSLAGAICYDSAYSVTFAGTCVGGNGGIATAVASDGADCGICGFDAGKGGYALAKGGRGGNCYFYFAMSPPPPPALLAGHLIPTGSWTGGDGEDADATAGNGGSALIDCCEPPMPGISGGDGANANAYGGRKGKGSTANGLPGTGVAICGNGGNGKDGSPPGAAGAGSKSHDDVAPAVPSNTAACPPGLPGMWCPQPWIPWNPRWDLGSGYKFGQDDTTVSGSLYEDGALIGNIPIRLLGSVSAGGYTGDSQTVPVYYEQGPEGMRCYRGVIVLPLTSLPNGATAEGFYAMLSNHSTQPSSLHLLAYSGGNEVAHEVGSSNCADSTLEIPSTLARASGAAAVLDSVVIWGLDFSFEQGFGLGIELTQTECPIVMTGDVNLSGTITSADIIGMVNYVFKGGATPQPCAAAGDVNCNGSVTSSDIIVMVNHVFKGGPPPCDGCTSPLAAGC